MGKEDSESNKCLDPNPEDFTHLIRIYYIYRMRIILETCTPMNGLQKDTLKDMYWEIIYLIQVIQWKNKRTVGLNLNIAIY